MQKRLYRSKRDRVLAGVCAGIADYLDVDPTLIRLAWVIFCFMGGAGILAYFIAMIIIPENPKERVPRRTEKPETERDYKYEHEKQGALIGGLILIFLGTFFLASNFGMFAWLNWTLFWPVMIIGIGIILLLTGSVRKW